MLNLTKIEAFFQDKYIFAEIKAFTKKANTQYVCKIKKKYKFIVVLKIMIM